MGAKKFLGFSIDNGPFFCYIMIYIHSGGTAMPANNAIIIISIAIIGGAAWRCAE